MWSVNIGGTTYESLCVSLSGCPGNRVACFGWECREADRWVHKFSEPFKHEVGISHGTWAHLIHLSLCNLGPSNHSALVVKVLDLQGSSMVWLVLWLLYYLSEWPSWSYELTPPKLRVNPRLVIWWCCLSTYCLLTPCAWGKPFVPSLAWLELTQWNNFWMNETGQYDFGSLTTPRRNWGHVCDTPWWPVQGTCSGVTTL